MDNVFYLLLVVVYLYECRIIIVRWSFSDHHFLFKNGKCQTQMVRRRKHFALMWLKHPLIGTKVQMFSSSIQGTGGLMRKLPEGNANDLLSLYP